MHDGMSPRQFHETTGLEDWRVLAEGATAYFRTGSFAASVRLAAAIGALEGIEQHPPDIDVRRDGVTVRAITIASDWYGVTRRDADLATRISAIAREHDAAADPSAVQTLLVIPGAADTSAVMPFWKAVLGYEPRADSPDEDLVDPRARGASFWFEAMDKPRGDGGGGAIHMAVWVAPELAEARVAAALAVGGRIVRDSHAPAWWTLADEAGNEVDVATTVGRD